MIFLTVTGSFTAAVMYDRRQKRHIQQKWSDLVAHIAKEPLPLEQNRRRLTIFLSAPPGDGLRPARDYFKEYIKPILVSAALDYEVIEGRKEGEVRAGLADKIRNYRRQAGERSHSAQEPSKESAIAETRERMGIKDEPGPRGDIVIGRHTWKEYIRGLHEGWLGPLDPAPPPPPPTSQPDSAETVPILTKSTADAKQPTVESVDSVAEVLPDVHAVATQNGSSSSEPRTPGSSNPQDENKEAENKESEESKKPKGPTPAYISPTEYSAQQLPPTIPATFEASSPIQFPHLLGFLNTPVRIYRFLTKRHLADAVGQEVAAAVLASASRPYEESIRPAEGLVYEASTESSNTPSQISYEQQTILEHEEQEWHKSVRKEAADRKLQAYNDNPSIVSDDAAAKKLFDEEREWIDELVIDPRIASRMHRYILSPEQEARANRIASGQEWILGEGEKPKKLSFWQRAWIRYGYGEDPELAKKKPIIGNLDNENGE